MPIIDDIHYRENTAHDNSGIVHQQSPTFLYDVDGLIFAPDLVNDEVAIYHVDADIYPNGIMLQNIQITLPADAAYSMVFERWSGDPPVHKADIETVSTGASDSYKEVAGTDIDNRILYADDYIYLHVPATDVDWVHVKVIFYPGTE